MADTEEVTHWSNKDAGPTLVVDGYRHVLTIPPVSDHVSAQLTEDFINHYGVADRITQMARSAHVPGSSAPKLIKQLFAKKFSIFFDTDESITNLLMFMKKRNQMWRTLLASESKDSGFDKVIDATLMMAFEDISMEYARMSNELRDLSEEDNPDPITLNDLTKKTHHLRKEMLRFKELVRPAEQKVDLDDKRSVERKQSNELVEALNRLNIGPVDKKAISSAN